jgi:hypothetical protein
MECALRVTSGNIDSPSSFSGRVKGDVKRRVVSINKNEKTMLVAISKPRLNAPVLPPILKGRVNFEKACSAVPVLLTSTKKMPQKLDGISSYEARFTKILRSGHALVQKS